MRGSRCKAIRKHVRKTYPMLPEGGLYKAAPNGVSIVLAPMTQRAFYQNIKDNYKKWRKGEYNSE